MIQMHMGDDQGPNALHVKTERRSFCTVRCLGALFETTVDQQTGEWVEVQLVARPGNAAGPTVMGKAGIFHAAHTHLKRK
ncbi:hypothetical protein PPUJ20028_26800 [Pseudomonas putida]|uniref:Uncharacterized protein n=1 Tax=Pseudomonas putida TaxID=303 RepID=A0AA37RDY0_PSEPU|nr:hypothetical protein PPUJ20028_26800 [Pseudomonas putida]GLO33876.1 hypothetical protein PPUN14671_07090 [Pseudomonas putida]